MKKYCIGIDVGGTTVKLGVFTIKGELQLKWEIKTRKEDGGANIISDIAASIQSMLAEKNIPMEEVAGAGIGVPGPIMKNGYVERCVNLGWADKNPAVELTNILDIPVMAANDANVAALGEMWKGGGEGFDDVVMITLGTGVGGGVVLDGKIVSGNRGLAGELGHITVNYGEHAACNCGNHGCLEQYASATGIVRVARKLLQSTVSDSVLRDVKELSAKAVFDAAKEKDALAIEAVETLGRYLGQVISAVAMTIDPDVFVIGGGVSKAGDILIEVVDKYYKKFTTISSEKVPIRLAALGNDAGIYGAAKLILE